MSDMQLESEITQIVNTAGYSKSKCMLCPIMKIVSMRHKDVPQKQIYKVAKSIF